MNIESFDVRAWLDSLGIEWSSEGSKNVGRGWIGLQCIYCDDQHNHMGINMARKNYHCWLCEAHGSILTLIEDIQNISRFKAQKVVDEFQGDEEYEDTARQPLEDKGQLLLPEGVVTNLTGQQRSYLMKRGFKPQDLITDWGIMNGGYYGMWKHRIIIPIEYQKRMVTWIGMDADRTTGKVKYLAAPVEESFIPSSELLYGGDTVGKHVLVVEGATDAWRMGKGTVATLGMGQGLTPVKMRSLLDLPCEKYFVMYDGEPAAIANAKELAHSLGLASGRQTEVIELSEGDPAALTQETADAIRAELEIGQ